jgi:large subunit ribosomal protein L15
VRLNELSPAPGSRRERKRVGRGSGSGYGKTAGRGTKGYKSRSGGQVDPTYEGGQLPLQRRLPRLKGVARGRHKPTHPTVYQPVNLSRLEEIGKDEIGVEDLREAGIIRKRETPVKILGDGEVSRALKVRAHAFSRTAREKIEAAGGTAEVLER